MKPHYRSFVGLAESTPLAPSFLRLAAVAEIWL